jgi:hypothetical protein
MNDKEVVVIKEHRGPSAALKADAKRYMTESAYRKLIDDADKAEGTQTGPKLRRIFYGQPDEVQAPASQTKPQPTPVQLKAAMKKYPKERCLNLFVGTRTPSGENRHSEILSKLSKEERDEARLAARQWGIPLSGENSGASVRFNYETSRDRRLKREAKEADAEAAKQREADRLPPGITRHSDGTLSLSDSVAFAKWKADKEANRQAIEFLEEQAAA